MMHAGISRREHDTAVQPDSKFMKVVDQQDHWHGHAYLNDLTHGKNLVRPEMA